MTRRRTAALILLTTLTACGVSDSTAPPVRSRVATAPATHDAIGAPQVDRPDTPNDKLSRAPIPCIVSSPLSGSETIGSKGGTINIGPHRFVVPKGALSSPVTITARVPAGLQLLFDFEPSGLVFEKDAMLIIDVSRCQAVHSDVVHLDEIDGELQRITAALVDLLHIVVAPIKHFSSYALDV